MVPQLTCEAPVFPDMNPNVKGALFMIAAMFGFAAEDALLKASFETVPRGVAFTAFGFMAAVFCALLSVRAGEKKTLRSLSSR